LTAAFSSAQYLGSFYISNNCPETVYVWSTADTIGPMQTLKTGQHFIEYAHRNPQTGTGITVFISKDPDGLTNGSPLLLLAYSVDPTEQDNARIWYELDTLRGSPFEGQKVWLGGDACPEIRWEDGREPGEQVVKN
ncbi:uncharacterized protein EI97DRAFT_354090, partial [Westerdykella ornata]